MELVKDYVSLEDTLLGLKQQVVDSMATIGYFLPGWIETPEQLFTYLKNLVVYKDDPTGIELIREVDTLYNNNWEGDCDCFTVLTLAASEYLDFPRNYVSLVSNYPDAPTHIYSMTLWGGDLKSLDLTNPVYNQERKYKYQQILHFKL